MDKRTRLILAFAVRFLLSNLDDDVAEALDDLLNENEEISIIEGELEELAVD